MEKAIYFRKLFFKKRSGISLVECLILILIVSFTIAAILQTSVITSNLQVAGRDYVNSHKAAAAFFQALKTVEAENIFNNPVSIDAFVRDALASERTARYISNPQVRSTDGRIIVSVTVRESATSSRVMEMSYNVFSNQTVDDDRIVMQ